MQPRQGVEVQEIVKESPTAAEVSGVEVQPEVPKEAVLEGVGGDSEGEGLALESVQNLESQPQEEEIAAENPENESIVAQPLIFEPKTHGITLQVNPEVAEELATMLEASKERKLEQLMSIIREEEQVEPSQEEDSEGLAIEEAAKMGLPVVDGADTYIIYRDGVGEMWKSDGKSVSKIGEELNLNPLGELPTGEYRATVRLAEGYVEGAKQQAESDGITLEDWLTLQLNAYLEQWWMAPGPR